MYVSTYKVQHKHITFVSTCPITRITQLYKLLRFIAPFQLYCTENRSYERGPLQPKHIPSIFKHIQAFTSQRRQFVISCTEIGFLRCLKRKKVLYNFPFLESFFIARFFFLLGGMLFGG